MTSVVALRGAGKRFGGVHAVDRFSLDILDGELLALLGPSGCGKSTALRLIAGLEAPDEGEVCLEGERVAGPGAWRPAERRNVGVVFQDHALFPHLTVAENVAFGIHRHGRRARQARVDAVLHLVAMRAHAGRYPHELSGGETQRIALARALAPEPGVVLLDEPFSDLDRNLRTRVRADTVRVLRAAGATAVFVTHDQEEALEVGDRVAVMRAGSVEQVDSPSAVFHAPANRFVATFIGEADFLPVRSGEGRAATEAGPLPLPGGTYGDDTARHGSHAARGAEVMVRPHEVRFDADHSGNARVVGASFQGAFFLYELELDSGRRLRSLQPHTLDCAVGTRVRVWLDHGHRPVLFPAEAGPEYSGGAVEDAYAPDLAGRGRG